MVGVESVAVVTAEAVVLTAAVAMAMGGTTAVWKCTALSLRSSSAADSGRALVG